MLHFNGTVGRHQVALQAQQTPHASQQQLYVGSLASAVFNTCPVIRGQTPSDTLQALSH